MRRRRRRPAPRPATASAAAAQPVQHGRRVEVGGEQELRHLVLHVVAQPGDRGELGPVGLLVQAHPQPEVVRVDLELPLRADDVGRDERRGRPAGAAARGVRAAGTARTGRAPGSPGRRGCAPDLHRRSRASPRPAMTAPPDPPPRPCRARLSGERLEDDAEAVDVGLDPAGPVDDRDRGRASVAPSIPVNSRTWPCATADSSRSSATTSRASSGLTCGPGQDSGSPSERRRSSRSWMLALQPSPAGLST